VLATLSRWKPWVQIPSGALVCVKLRWAVAHSGVVFPTAVCKAVAFRRVGRQARGSTPSPPIALLMDEQTPRRGRRPIGSHMEDHTSVFMLSPSRRSFGQRPAPWVGRHGQDRRERRLPAGLQPQNESGPLPSRWLLRQHPAAFRQTALSSQRLLSTSGSEPTLRTWKSAGRQVYPNCLVNLL
jgi:hypothetical protein